MPKPAPPHSDRLLYLWRRKITQPELELWGRTWDSTAAYLEWSAGLRRAAATRARRRRHNGDHVHFAPAREQP